MHNATSHNNNTYWGRDYIVVGFKFLSFHNQMQSVSIISKFVSSIPVSRMQHYVLISLSVTSNMMLSFPWIHQFTQPIEHAAMIMHNCFIVVLNNNEPHTMIYILN